MRRALVVVVVVALMACASVASAANILDLIYRGAEVGAPQREQADAPDDQQDEHVGDEKACECAGPECVCCVDFNMTFIDLGKGCVKMKYISQAEGVLLNVSYGDNLLRSGTSRGPRPSATCVAMIGQLAAVCARFTVLLPHRDGLKGCLKLEPKLLGDVQTRLSIGCFAMTADGMRLDDGLQQELERVQEATTAAPAVAAAAAAEANTNQTGNAEEGATDNLNEAEILAAVSASAQKGLAFFQNWLGFDLDGGGAGNATQQEEAQDDEHSEAARAARQIINAAA